MRKWGKFESACLSWIPTAFYLAQNLFNEFIGEPESQGQLFARDARVIENDESFIAAPDTRIWIVHPASVLVLGTLRGEMDSVLSVYCILRRLTSVACMVCEHG